MNLICRVLDSFLNLKVVYEAAQANADGTTGIGTPQVIITEQGAVITLPGPQQFPWQVPKELDPNVPVLAGEFVYISAENPLVTTGLYDLQSNTLTKASSGIWQSVRLVPAQTSNSGTVYYNVPKSITTATTPSGTPLTGDADVSGLFWIPWYGSGQSSDAGCYRLTVVGESTNYIGCIYVYPGNPLDGTSVNVAKPPELRGFVGSTTDSQGNSQSILPAYGAGDTIFADMPFGGTGVTSVVLQDLNVSARALATTLNTCENIAGVPTTKSRLFVCSTYF